MREDFTGFLICSDYDGTLSWGGVSRENIDAINEYMRRGGMFTLCTGRSGEDINRQKCLPVMPNVPIGGLCGSQIYDLAADRCLWRCLIDLSLNSLIKQTIEATDYDRVEWVHVGGGRTSSYREKGLEIPDDPLHKIVIFLKAHDPDIIPLAAREIAGDRLMLSANGEAAYEITAPGICKGAMARRLRDMTGAKTLVCVGDYDGDISMIREADIGYAVDNAIPALKAAADRITVHAKDHALKHIIEEL